MKTLDRYILRQFLVTLCATVSVIIGLYVLVHFLTNVSSLQKSEFSSEGFGKWEGLLRYYASHIPFLLVLFGPYAVLVAGVHTMHRMNQDGELIPLFSVGVGSFRAAVPVFVGALIIALGLVVLKEVTVPKLAGDMDRFYRLMKGRSEVQEELPLISDGMGNVFDINAWYSGELRLEGVTLYRPEGARALQFEALTWDADSRTWGTQGETQAFPLRESSDLSPFDLDMSGSGRGRMSLADIRRMLERRPDRRDLKLALHSHLAYPLVPALLLLLGLPMVLRQRRSGLFLGVMVCLGISLAFFSATLLLDRMGAQSTWLSPVLAAWLPSALCAGVGLVLFETIEA